MTPADIVAVNRLSDVQLANGGRQLAFVVTALDQTADAFNADIWTMLVDQPGSATRLTYSGLRDDHPRWSPNGQRLAFLSQRAGQRPQLFVINPLGGEAQQLTQHKAPVLDFEWSPSGRYIALLAETSPVEPASKPKHKTPIVVDEYPSPAQLWLLDVETQQLTQLTKGKLHITSFNWSYDNTQIAFTARLSPKLESSASTEIYLMPFDARALAADGPVDTAKARQLTRNRTVESQPAFSPDGRRVSWLAQVGDLNLGPDKLHILPLGETTAEQSQNTARVLAQNFNGYIRTYRWLFTGEILFNAGLGVNEQIYRIDINDRPVQALTRNDGVCASFAASFDGTQLVYTYESPRVAPELAGLNARTLLPQQLTQFNPQVSEFAIGQVETVKWPSRDNTEIEGLLVYPVGYDSSRRYPLMTYIHGGPEGAYTKSFNASWSAPVQALAGKGYAVFLPNFRGSSNYGMAFAQANTTKAGQVDYDDVLTGIDALIKRGLVDENKLAIGGWSYGGYLSAWMIGHTNRFKAAVYGAGLSNAVSYWGTADITYQRERLHGGTPWAARKMFDEQSPLTYLPNAKTPTLIFHGEKDERVPLGQSQESYRTLKRLGIPVQFVIYPEQGHGLLVPSYQRDKLERELRWLDQYLVQ